MTVKGLEDSVKSTEKTVTISLEIVTEADFPINRPIIRPIFIEMDSETDFARNNNQGVLKYWCIWGFNAQRHFPAATDVAAMCPYVIKKVRP